MVEPEQPGAPAANDSWRTWVMTGSRRAPSDRRRVRGSHKGLKKMLVEGMRTGGEQAYSWKEFSDAMIRQSVSEALRTLPSQEAQMVKLAYFGGLSNRQIAARFGTTESTVQRRLRRALADISSHIERGRSLGRRVVCALAVWLSGRWLGDASHHLAQAGLVLGAAAVIVAQPASAPVQLDVSPRHATALAAAPNPAVIAMMPSERSSSSTAVIPPAVQPASAKSLALPRVGAPEVSLPIVQVPIAAPIAPPAPVELRLPI